MVSVRRTDESFDDFVVRTGPALVRFGTGLTGDRAAGEDLAQEALTRCWSSWQRSSFPEHQDAYARRVMLRIFLRGRERTRPTATATDIADRTDDPAASVVERDLCWHALQGLSRAQRAVLVLRYYEDLPDERIADLLGCPTSTIRSHAARALAKLRTLDELRPHPGATR